MSRGVSLVLAFFLLAGCDGESSRQDAPIQLIDNLTMERLDGGPPERIEDLRGKIVILNIWATWCAPCRREMPGLQELADRLDPARYVVAGLSIDESPVLVREYLRRSNIDFARHIDRGGNAATRRLSLGAVPTTLVLGPDGSLLREVTGERDWADPGTVLWLQGLM